MKVQEEIASSKTNWSQVYFWTVTAMAWIKFTTFLPRYYCLSRLKNCRFLIYSQWKAIDSLSFFPKEWNDEKNNIECIPACGYLLGKGSGNTSACSLSENMLFLKLGHGYTCVLFLCLKCMYFFTNTLKYVKYFIIKIMKQK